MGHEIFGERWLGRREPAWHALGTIFAQEENLTVSQAFARADILYRYEKFPLIAENILPGFGGQEMLISEKVALYRSPTGDDDQYRLMGIVDADYGVVQPIELAQALDGLCGQWPVETVGALRSGAIVFATLKQQGYAIKGEEVESYFLLSNGQGVDQSLRIAITDVRVVCMNTLTAALDASPLQVSVSHHRDIHADMARYVELMANAELAAKRQRDLFALLAEARITREDAQRVMAATFVDPRPPTRLRMLGDALTRHGFLEAKAQELLAEEERQHEMARERAAQFRLAGEAIFETWGDRPSGGRETVGTAWAAYNAAVEVSDCRRGQSVASAAAATLFGDRAQERARAFKASALVAGLN